MRRFLTTIGLGFGLAVGGGLAYALITSDTARLFIFSFGAFVLGAIIVGLAIIGANRVLLQGLFNRPDRENTTVNYRFPRPTIEQPAGVFPPWSGQQPPALPPAPSVWGASPQAPAGSAGGYDGAPSEGWAASLRDGFPVDAAAADAPDDDGDDEFVA